MCVCVLLALRRCGGGDCYWRFGLAVVGSTATTRLRVLVAWVGLIRRRTSAWTQDVRCRALELWLRWRVFDGCLKGSADPRAGGVRVVAGRVVLARVVLVLVAAW